MILCVCLNPAIDVTYEVNGLQIGASHRAEVIAKRAGGKALNVARILHQMKQEPVVATMLGGQDGSLIHADLVTEQIEVSVVPIAGSSRHTVTVFDGTEATVFNESGPSVSETEFSALLRCCESLAGKAQVVVIAGSAPPGVPVDCYAQLTAVARSAGARVILDVGGAYLVAGLAAGPDVVKPNRHELGEAVGRTLSDEADVLRSCQVLLERGAGAVVLSMGADGLLALTADERFRVRLTTPIPGNPTGAGDALTAGLARGLYRAQDWKTCLVEAAAVAAASVTIPVAGRTDLELAEKLNNLMEVELIL